MIRSAAAAQVRSRYAAEMKAFMVDSLRSVDCSSGLRGGRGDRRMATGGRSGGLDEAHAHDEADQHGSSGAGEVSIQGGNEGVHGGLLGGLFGWRSVWLCLSASRTALLHWCCTILAHYCSV